MSALPLPYQLSIFGTPLGAKFRLDNSRDIDGRILTGKALPTPYDNRFVVASGARSMPGQYIRHQPGLGAYHWRSAGLGQADTATRATICNQNCGNQFNDTGRAARCYNICVNAGSVTDCDDCNKRNTGGFGPMYGRRGKCRAACTMSITGAIAPTEEGFLPPGMAPGAGIGSTLVPILAVGGAALLLIYVLKRKKKKAK